ncbi:MAG TPA: VOC family protein [Planctomycetota bacterium]|nr:VOC family protein [Planctomycetota bacterium]
MIDHVGYGVRDYEKSKAFYAKALAPLGYAVAMEFDHEGKVAGFAANQKPDFWIHADPAAKNDLHLAFLAADRATVDAFHAAALAAGGTDNGKPGLRPEYHPNYYGAFVYDPDGNNIEACCHKPA